MYSFTKAAWSSVGKKIMTGVTGLALCVFIAEHLIANSLMFLGPDAFNAYTHKLTTMGGLLYALEGGLVLAFLLHAVTGISIWLNKRRARPQAYVSRLSSKGGASKQTFSSRTMIYTGLVLLVFIVVHLKTFKYGPNYETLVDGVRMRDLYRLVVEVFQSPAYAFGYVAVMALLGFHLRHGFWSAFQSLGVSHPRYVPIIYRFGILFAFVIALGFLVLPLWIYYGGGKV